jgi:hypothetical protein
VAEGGAGGEHVVSNPLVAVDADQTGTTEQRVGTGGLLHVRGGSAEKKVAVEEAANGTAVPTTEMADTEEATGSKQVV